MDDVTTAQLMRQGGFLLHTRRRCRVQFIFCVMSGHFGDTSLRTWPRPHNTQITSSKHVDLARRPIR
ncbi:hypothetical protein VTJ04DRAFT_3551 [Mycothermus thermophilus]|uniref:uncharacterized protein n=1 Tax=Humicola insolens TaxID=85995 RepID=UPI003742B836